MSILSDAWRGKTTWSTALSRAMGWVQKTVGADPASAQAAADVTSAVKQGLSDAIGMADTELGQHYAGMVDTVESAADALLANLFGPVGLAASPIANGTIQQIAKAGKAALDAWALQTQSALVPAASPPAPILTPGQVAVSAAPLSQAPAPQQQ